MYEIFFTGKPVQVEISISLRNILEIDEHKQVNTIRCFALLYTYNEKSVLIKIFLRSLQSNSLIKTKSRSQQCSFKIVKS